MQNNKKITVIMPAYNAEVTLEKTCKDIPVGYVDEIILGDDASNDNTVNIAKKLGIIVLAHEKNLGYGANQKTCYKEALARNADIVIMIHPDYQYDAKKIPELVAPLLIGSADAVFGSRMLNGGALKGGMPVYKYISNKFLTFFENMVLKYNLSEYHTGLRAYTKRVLQTVPWNENSDGFLFDTQIIVQLKIYGFKISEIPIETRYFKEASQVGFFAGCKYGIGTLLALLKYKFR